MWKMEDEQGSNVDLTFILNTYFSLWSAVYEDGYCYFYEQNNSVLLYNTISIVFLLIVSH